MKKVRFFLSALCLFVLTSVSVSAATHEVVGTVVDGKTGEGVVMAAVRLFSYQYDDSTMVQGVQADYDGNFRLEKVKSGQYSLLVSSLGYREAKVNVTVGRKDVELQPIKLQEDVKALSEVTVTGHAAEMTVKGDTLEYNTAAYQVGETDMVEDLLKKMAGVQVDSEGNVTVNGESITAIRIDGKKFFGDDVQSATKNIPADMIDKIQVIDEKSEMAKLTGFDDDEGERIINLKLKEDKKKGLFGNFVGGLGADLVTDNGKWFDYNKRFFEEDFRYNASAFMNILSGESQTTVIAGANNTNEMRSGRGRGPMMGNNSGITWAENVGVNTNIAGKNGWMYGGDMQVNHSYNDTHTKAEKTQWTDDYTYQQNDSTSKQSNTADAKARLEFEYTIDTLNSLIIKPEIAYTYTLADQLREYDYFRDGDTTTIGSQQNHSKQHDVSASLQLIYNHKFLKKGRTLTLNATTKFTDTNANSHNESENWSEGVQNDINQWTRKDQDAINYELKASYVEPVYKTNHFIETALTFAGNNRKSTKNQYEDEAMTVLDKEFSNTLRNTYFSEAVEVNYKWVEQYFDLTAGLKLNPSQTISHTTYGTGERVNRENNVVNFSPNASFKYKFGKKQFARIQYRGTSSQPSITQMEPVRDNSNAMSETVGNLNLLPQFQHTLRFMYSKFNQDRFSSVMTGLRGTLTKDALVANNIYDQTGKLYQQTVNAKTYPFSVNADFMYNTPFLNKMFQFNTRTSVGYNRRIAYVTREMQTAVIEQLIEENTWQLGDESKTGNMQASEDLNLRFTHSVVDVGLRGNFTYSYTYNNLTQNSQSHVFNYTITGDLAFHLPKSWEIATDFGYTDRIGYGKDLGNLSELMWNASVSKTWSYATLSVKAYDLLNQKKNVVQTVGENYVQYQRFNTLPTYVMISFTYKLNRMGDLKAKGRAGVMQEMMETGGQQNGGVPPMGPPPM